MRAAAFGYGVLEELRETLVELDGERVRLFDEIDTVSGVSGGSFVAAYHGLRGEGIFGDFEAQLPAPQRAARSHPARS